MKKLISALVSAALVLSVSATGLTQGFAAEVSDVNSAQASAYADNYGAEVYADYANVYADSSAVDYPMITRFTPSANGVKVSWTQYDGAAKYRLYIFTDGVWKKIGETSSTSLVHKNPTNGVTYLYTVRALDSQNKYVSSYYKQGFENTFYAPPVISSVTSTFDGVSVKWGKYNGVESYRVYRKTSGSDWKNIGDCQGTKYVDSEVYSGTKYTYTVRCLNSDGKLISGYNGGKSVTYVKAPQITKLENTATGTKVSWTKSQGAAKYRLYYLNSSNAWRAIGTTSDTTLTHNKLKTGTTYKYTVRCLDSKGNFVSGYDKVGASNTFVAPPTISSLTNTNGGVQVKWGKISSAASYRVYRKTSGTSWTSIGKANGTSYVDKKVSSGTTYKYTVRCLNSDGKLISSYNSGKAVTYVKAPQITRFENTATGTKVSWTKSQGAAKYRLYYLNSNNEWKAIGTTSDTTLAHNKLKTGTTYKYTVRCLDSKGNFVSSYDKAGKSNLFLAPPAISKVSKANGGNLVEWKAVEGAAGYRLYRKTISSSWSKIAEGTKLSYLDTAVQSGRAYTYTLRCLDKNGKVISYYISNTKYYVDGKLANGKVTENGKTYNFSNGIFRKGYQRIGGKRYYYNSNGLLQKNGIVGSEKEGWYYADKNGVCCESEEIRLAAEYMMKYCEGDTLDEKMKSGFLYMAKNFPYHRTYDHPKGASDIPPLAIDMFRNHRGNCFRYASCFACVAKIAGYRTRVVIGTTSGMPHGWTEVLVDGEWLICDPDAQLPGYNVPDYTPYMMKRHYWQLTANVKCEVTIKDGKAIWK